MGKLKNAPLLEVIFELRWQMVSSDDWSKYPYLHGDLFSLLKNDYPVRELLTPTELPSELLINRPVYRVKSENTYPLYQVGPGLITLNTTGSEYDWSNYSKSIDSLLKAFLTVYKFDKEKQVSPTLSYFDFFKIDWSTENIMSFIKENLNIHISHNFFDTSDFPHTFGWNIGYDLSIGKTILNINTGLNNKNERGIIVQTRIEGDDCIPEISTLQKWLSEAHEFCSMLFKNLTKGTLFTSFN